MHDYQRMLPDKEGGHYGSMVQVFKDMSKGDYTVLADGSLDCFLNNATTLTSLVLLQSRCTEELLATL